MGLDKLLNPSQKKQRLSSEMDLTTNISIDFYLLLLLRIWMLTTTY